MAKLFAVTCIFAIWLAVAAMNCAAQSAPSQSPMANAPGPATADCSTLIYNMMDCMTFLTKGGDEDKPDKSCCSGFKTVVDTDAECICYALSNSASLGLNIDMTKAAALPSACGVSGAPPISSCGISPGASPVSNPPGASPASPPEVGPPSDSPNLSPTSQPPAAALTPGAAPASSPTAGADVPTPEAEAPSHVAKSGAYTISATFSVVLLSWWLFRSSMHWLKKLA